MPRLLQLNDEYEKLREENKNLKEKEGTKSQGNLLGDEDEELK